MPRSGAGKKGRRHANGGQKPIVGQLVAREEPFDPFSQVTEKDMLKFGMLQLSLRECADYYAILYEVFRRLLALRPSLRAAYNKGKAQGIVTMASHLMRKAADGDSFALKMYLDAANWRRDIRETPEYGGDEIESDDGPNAPGHDHGVLVVPADTLTVEEWEQRQRERAAKIPPKGD